MIRSYKGIHPIIPATCYVDDSAQIIGDVVLGEHASVWMNAVLRGDVHEIRIGAHSNVQDCSVLHGMKEAIWGVYLGEYVTVGHSVTLHGCVIEDRCLIGMGSIIPERREDRRGIDHCRRNADPREDGGRARVAVDGLSGKIPPQAGRERSGNDHALRRNYLGYKEEYLKESSSRKQISRQSARRDAARLLKLATQKICHPERSKPVRRAHRFAESKDPLHRRLRGWVGRSPDSCARRAEIP
jgi:hypothetical protein